MGGGGQERGRAPLIPGARIITGENRYIFFKNLN